MAWLLFFTMMQNMAQEQLPNDEITSPLGAQIFEFCESELFQETVQKSEGVSSSNCGGGGPTSPSAAAARDDNNNLAILMDDHTVDDISASIDFTLSPSFSVAHDQQYDPNQEPFAMDNAAAESLLYAPHLYNPEQPPPLPAPPFPVAPKEECQSSYDLRLRSDSPACTLSDPTIGSYLSSSSVVPPFPFDSSWLFFSGGGAASGLLLGTDFSNHELESQRDMHDSLARVFNCSNGDLQTMSSSESQHMLNGSPITTLASEISSLEDPSFKVGKLSADDRKKKINRYLKKKNERNFSKKIKYACRKTLADSRPRVRGRFAKNDELSELARNAGNNQDDDVDEDVNQMFRNSISDHQHKAVKEEDGIDPSELFAHINDVNSFKCNYPIQSWI